MPASHLHTRTFTVVILSIDAGAGYENFGTNNYVTIRPIQLALIPFKVNVRLREFEGSILLEMWKVPGSTRAH